MERQYSGHLHFICAVKGGVVTKVPNVSRGRPKLSFRDVADIYDGLSHKEDVIADRSCSGEIEERIGRTEPDASACNTNDGDDQRIDNLDDDGVFENFTLQQIKESCKMRKRKHSRGLDSPRRKIIKVEDWLSLEDNRTEQMVEDDSDFMETLSCLKSKLSKNPKKKKCPKNPIPTNTQEILLVVKTEEIQHNEEFPPSSEEIQNGQEFPPSSEEIQNGQEFPPSSEEIQNGLEFPPSGEEIQSGQEFQSSSEEFASSIGDSTALVEVKSEVPETDYFGGLDDYSVIEGHGVEITYEWNLENELNYERHRHFDLIPLRMVMPSCMDIVISNSQLENDQSPNFPAIEFESEKCIIHPDLLYSSSQVISLVEDQNSDIYDNQPDDDIDTQVSLPEVVTHEDLECLSQECKDEDTFLADSSKDEFTTSSVDQVKPNSSIAHNSDLDGCLVSHSDDPPQLEEKQSFASILLDEKRHVNEAPDELASWDDSTGSSKLHRPERLLSTRKAISPSSQQRLCKAMDSIDLHHKSNLKCKGKLNFAEHIDKNIGTTAGGPDGITRTRSTNNNPTKISVIPRTFKRVSHPRGVSKIPHSYRAATRLGCSSVQSCSKNAIAFTQQQMHDTECITMKLTKELNSLKDIMNDMLRSEFCLNTSLRHKVNEARMAVKYATRAEEAAERCVAFMKRNCSRFYKIMKLSDDGPPSQDIVRKERKKIAFADEAGGSLCHVKFYEDDEVPMSESNRN
ncbi:hypothetical protein RJT34_22144 [Clitoria ternatea]|uniref:Uncharacterized protein n=1 Tax=Clitoria ternatea TaxID=43366 RepID=A0AAN9IUY4_CLITE